MPWLVTGALSLVLIGVRAAALPRENLFWDQQAYVRALGDFLQGGNPYRADVAFPFVYHPIVLAVFSLFGSQLARVLSVASVAMAAWFVVTSASLPVADKGHLLLAASAIGGFGVTSVASGNITTPLHFLLIAVVIAAATSGEPSRIRRLTLLLVGLALIKPYFLAYAILPVVLARSRSRAIATLGASAVALALIVFGDYLARPALSRAFLDALSQLVVRGDLGIGVFRFLTHHGYSSAVSMIGHLAVVAGAGAVTAGAFTYCHADGVRDLRLMRALLVYFVCTLLNPRMQVYDVFPALVCLLFCCGLVVRGRMLTMSAAALALLATAIPSAIEQFARDPEAWTPLLRNDLLPQLTALGIVWVAFLGICVAYGRRDRLVPQVQPGA